MPYRRGRRDLQQALVNLTILSDAKALRDGDRGMLAVAAWLALALLAPSAYPDAALGHDAHGRLALGIGRDVIAAAKITTSGECGELVRDLPAMPRIFAERGKRALARITSFSLVT